MLNTSPSHRSQLPEVLSHAWMTLGYPGPPDTHIPERTPLRADEIDADVIKGMHGFEFGTSEEIERRLREVLESDGYKRACEATQVVQVQPSASSASIDAVLANANSGGGDIDLKKSQRRFSGIGFDYYRRKLFTSPSPRSSAPSSPTSTRSGTTHATTNPTLSSSSLLDEPPIPPPDPTRGFHPLISIYFLVREKMDREREYGEGWWRAPIVASPPKDKALEMPAPPQKAVTSPTSAAPPQTLSAPAPLAVAVQPTPRLRVAPDAPEAASPTPTSPGFPLPSTPGSATLPRAPAPATHRRTPSASTPVPMPSPIVTVPTPTTPSSTTPRDIPLPQFPSRPAEPAPPPQSHEPPQTAGPELQSFRIPTAPEGSSGAGGTTLSRRFGSILGHQRRRTSSLVATRPSTAQEPRSIRVSEDGSRPATASEAEEGVLSDGESGHRRAVTVSRGLGTIGRRWKGARAELSTRAQRGDGIVEEDETEATAQPVSRQPETDSDDEEENFKPVHMKGLFSVATTSTKPPATLRADLRRVLARMQVQHRDVKGGMECVYVPSITVPASRLGRKPSGTRSITKKASRISFKRRRDQEKEKEKDLPAPPLALSQPQPNESGSSALVELAATARAALELQSPQRSPEHSPTRRARPNTGTQPPVTRDFGALTQNHPHGPEDNPMGVRFEVHIVKVREMAAQLVYSNLCTGADFTFTWYSVPAH